MEDPYSVGTQHSQPSVVEGIQSLKDLKQWIDSAIASYQREFEEFSSQEIAGRIYVADSIRFRESIGLSQTGSAPGYFGGVWSLSTCKKRMRGEPREGAKPNPNHNFRQLFRDPDDRFGLKPTQPVFIITCASGSQERDVPNWADSSRNWMANISMVTRGFNGMDEYEQYLRKHHQGPAYNYRVSGRTDAPTIARRKGDCHVDDEGNVCFPPDSHDHDFEEAGEFSGSGCTTRDTSSPDPEDYIDNSRAHVKCLSEPGYWIGWSLPRFAVKPDQEAPRAEPKINGIHTIDQRFEQVR